MSKPVAIDEPATARANGRMTACATGSSFPFASTSQSDSLFHRFRRLAVLPLGAAQAERVEGVEVRLHERERARQVVARAELADPHRDVPLRADRLPFAHVVEHRLGGGRERIEVRREDHAVARRTLQRRREVDARDARGIDEHERRRREPAHVRHHGLIERREDGRGERVVRLRSRVRLVDRLEAEHAGLVLVARDHHVPRGEVLGLDVPRVRPKRVERGLHVRVVEIRERPLRAVVVRRGRVRHGPPGEAVAAIDLGVNVLVEVDHGPDAARPRGVEDRVVAREPLRVVLALRRLERRPRERDAHDVDAPARRAIHVLCKRSVEVAPEVERHVGRELAAAARVDPAKEDDAPEAVFEIRAVGREPEIRLRARNRAHARDGLGVASRHERDARERGDDERPAHRGRLHQRSFHTGLNIRARAPRSVNIRP